MFRSTDIGAWNFGRAWGMAAFPLWPSWQDELADAGDGVCVCVFESQEKVRISVSRTLME